MTSQPLDQQEPQPRLPSQPAPSNPGWTTPSTRVAPLSPWAADIALGLGWFLLGTLGLRLSSYGWKEPVELLPALLLVAGMSVAVAMFRRAPDVAFGLVWFACVGQVVTGTTPTLAEFGVAVVAFGAARYGSTAVLVASGLSIPAAYVIAGLYFYARPWFAVDLLGQTVGNRVSHQAGDAFGVLLVVLAGVTLLVAVPWLLGLLLRSQERLSTGRRQQADTERLRALAEEQRAHAVEVSRVREQQARLARDVHDVVGHSLAVIVAQAESARYLPDEPERLKETLAAIAGVARVSLGDVRRVLSTAPDDVPAPPPGGLDDLVEGVRASGAVIRDVRAGTPVPLVGEQGVVAYRVLQEMLTNALKHGAPGEPVTVSQVWDDAGLLLEVGNRRVSPQSGQGGGIEGMRRRLSAVGGTLRVLEDDTTFVARAWLPVTAVPELPREDG